MIQQLYKEKLEEKQVSQNYSYCDYLKKKQLHAQPHLSKLQAVRIHMLSTSVRDTEFGSEWCKKLTTLNSSYNRTSVSLHR